MERLARLEVRRRLRAEGEQTYLDSLVSGTDSLLRRWPDPKPVTLRVAILPGDVAGYAPKMADFVREALERWETVGTGVAFRVVADTAGADVTVRWIEQFSRDRDGQTDVTWDRQGVIHHASIVLAVRDTSGVALPDRGLQAIALHETGHAIGLPHSGDPGDAMFPSARVVAPSERDRRTAAALYSLPPGDVRDPGDD
jgi:predicted Zn-dependent protease